METTDLRIGNLIYDDLGRVAQVSHLSITTVEAIVDKDGSSWTTVFQPKPIPIAPNWLLTFGFNDITKDDDFNCHFERLIGPFCIHFEVSNGPINAAHCWVDWIGIDLDYVHQLQNLCHSLTQCEIDTLKKFDDPI